ncbi:serine hydrolase domain-containing protein [Constantimarinum furrinae]|uniref:serine hydrolase domain-containing protein n=1 Tax=Constantimarinum furrinae TaxID=2562285 RepID=UPI00164C8480|nr:serine hydrolase domain-containing protein [Constantimarinum furrinae]
MDEEKLRDIDWLLTEKVEYGFSGSVLISENDNVMFAKGYGLADREHNNHNTENTKFEIASVTKLFTVVSILQLAERGKLSLNDKIDKHLGNFNTPKNQATINHLLLHTGGLVPRGFELDYNTRTGFVQSVKNAPVESIPGEKYRYTNAGYTLLAAIIEEVSQMPYEDYLSENIFKPLNLTNTTFGFEDSLQNVANGYAGNTIDSLELYKTPEYVWGDRGPSGIITNVTDLNKFLNGLDNNKLLGSAYLQKMYSEQMEGEAYGFHIIDRPDIGKVLARGGGLRNFESQIAWYKIQNIKVIILINNHLRTRQPIWDGIEKILFE